MKYKYIKLYSCCLPVKGAGRSAICDLQRKQLYFIPNSLHDLFSAEQHCFNIETVSTTLDAESKETLDEYISFLVENELAYKCSHEEMGHFPLMSTEWLFPAHISNCVIDAKNRIDYLNQSFLNQLEKLSCNYIQLRFFEQMPLESIQNILDVLNPAQIKSIELVFQYIVEKNFEETVLNFLNLNRKVRNIILYNAPRNAILKRDEFLTGSAFMTTTKVDSNLHCGIVQFEQFSINMPHYTESLHHNTCLHRKISIDAAGNIKNCPSMKESFGNIKDTTLQEALNKPGFKKYWNITKDQISVCKDCEFRHVCTDCRAYLENPEDDYSKPLKCGYDPYTCKWEEWSNHPMKQKAIAHYGLG